MKVLKVLVPGPSGSGATAVPQERAMSRGLPVAGLTHSSVGHRRGGGEGRAPVRAQNKTLAHRSSTGHPPEKRSS